MTALPPCRVGQIVVVEFYDHAEGSQKMGFVCYGRLARITKKAICIDCWHFQPPKRQKGRRIYDSVNETRYTILRSAIRRMWKTEVFIEIQP